VTGGACQKKSMAEEENTRLIDRSLYHCAFRESQVTGLKERKRKGEVGRKEKRVQN
jgi:hypothetical protein